MWNPGRIRNISEGKIEGKILDLYSILEPWEGYIGEKHIIINWIYLLAMTIFVQLRYLSYSLRFLEVYINKLP